MNYVSNVAAWHRAFGVPIMPRPVVIDPPRRRLRVDLIVEELDEFRRASEDGNLSGIADGIADLLYVTIGAALEYGIPIDRVFAEVHRSNMTKLGADGKPIRRDDGKVLKGPNYDAPCLGAILFDKRWDAER